MPSARSALVAIACLSVLSCSKQVAAPTEVLRSLVPPAIVATQPAARATGVLYDSDVWVQFDRPLEPSSVSTRTVFLKQDTRRITVSVTYEGLSRRILVHALTPLDLKTTYTVELSPRIKAFQGDSLGATAFFQFTTNTLRRVRYDFPVAGTTEGPLASLLWSPSGTNLTLPIYEVYAGDSAAVAARSVPYVQRVYFAYMLPRVRWPQGSDVFWSVTAINPVSGERLDGPVTRFRTFPADTPVDSLFVTLQDWGGRSQTSTAQQCNAPLLSVSPAHNTGMRFGVNALPSTIKVADARVELPIPDAYVATISAIAPVMHFAQNDWATCTFSYPGPPFPETNSVLATGAASATPNRAVFHSDAIGAFFEGQVRRLPYYGVVFRSTALVQFSTQPVNGVSPRAVIHYYRPGAAAQLVSR